MSTLLERYELQVVGGLRMDPGHDPIVHCVLGLVGESGEVADLHKKAQYQSQPPINPIRVREELGDVLWYLTALAARYDTSIEGLAKQNIAKLEQRRGGSYSLEKLLNG